VALATDLWMPYLLARLPGAAVDHTLAELRVAINDFCKESTAWRRPLRNVPTVIGSRNVPLNPQLGPSPTAKVIGVLKVYEGVLGKPLPDKTFFPMIDGSMEGWTSNADDPSIIELAAAPTQAGSLSVLVYLAPNDVTTWTTTDAPPVMTFNFWEAIFDGALARMFVEPDKPYSSTAAATYHLKRYRSKTREALAQSLAGFTPNGQNWSFPQFGR
jgi:hypothetical protein